MKLGCHDTLFVSGSADFVLAYTMFVSSCFLEPFHVCSSLWHSAQCIFLIFVVHTQVGPSRDQ